MPILSSTRLVAVLSETPIISRTASCSVIVVSGSKRYFSTPLPATMSLLADLDRVAELDLALGHLLIDLDQHGELAQAGRRHRLVGVEGVGLAGAEVLDGDGHLALWAFASGASTRFQTGRVFTTEAQRTQRKPEPQQPKTIASHGESPLFLRREVVVHGLRHLGAEQVAGIVGPPAVVLVVVGHHADGDRLRRSSD